MKENYRNESCIIHIPNFRLIGLVFANGPGDLGSIPGCLIPKTLKWYVIPPCLTLSIIRYVSRVKWSNPGKGVASSFTPRCISYLKGSLLVALDYEVSLHVINDQARVTRVQSQVESCVKTQTFGYEILEKLSLVYNIHWHFGICSSYI